MATWLKGYELRVRTCALVVGLLLFGICFAGALHWITLSRIDNLVLGVSILLFIIVGYLAGRAMKTTAVR